MIKLSSIVCALIVFCASLGLAETIDVNIKGVDDGIKTSKQQDYKEAVMNAKLQAIERAGVSIESVSKVVNFQLQYDAVESQSKGILLPGFQVVDIGYVTDGTYQVVLIGKLQVGSEKSPAEGKFNAAPIFEEHFTDNLHGWYLVNDRDKRFEIVKGKYILESKKGGMWISQRTVPLNQAADFKIDMIVRKISGTDNYGFGLSWGSKDVSNYYIFVVSGNGDFIHSRVENGNPERIISTYENSTNKGSGSTNILSLRKSGRNLDFYINNKYVGKAPFTPFFGDYMGCVIYSGKETITIEFDDIYVYGQ